jgi:uncharacterized protein (TIGR02145 family)
MVRIFGVVILAISVFSIHSCKKDKTRLPILTTADITEISSTSSTSGGDLINEGDNGVITRGVCWDTTSNPTIANSITRDSCGLGSYVSYISQLNPNTLYYVRAYATSVKGVGYGNLVSFQTNQIVVPVLTTTAITSITQTSSVSGGSISTDNGGLITLKGICWSNSPDPTVSDCKTSDGTGTGAYSSTLTGLTQNTTYYVRAYATNSAGTGYGNSISFTTQDNPAIFNPDVNYGMVTDIEGNVYKTIIIGTQTWMAENLRSSKYNNGEYIGTTIPAELNISGETTPVYQWAYEGKEGYVATYGRLYTWYTVIDNRKVCPTGWHVPTNPEWRAMRDYVQAGINIFYNPGGLLKEIGITHWRPPSTYYHFISSSNKTGFTALPAGYVYNGIFYGLGICSMFWTCSESVAGSDAIAWDLSHNNDRLELFSNYKRCGYSVRCIKD